MPKSYVESSTQTNQEDSNNHAHKEHCKSVSDCGIQTDECDPEKLTRVHHDEDADDASCIDHDGGMQRRFNPTRPDDFTTLQSELVQWRRREERKIAVIGTNEGQKQELTKLLLKKEAHILRKIDQLQNSATDKCKKERIRYMMELMCQPKHWETSDGFVIAVDTPETCRAKELKVMHEELNRAFEGGILKVEERIDLLEKIKAFVDAIDHCSLAKDVSMLLDRELQMLHRGTDLGQEFMEGMRKRLTNQFTKLVLRLNSDGCN